MTVPQVTAVDWGDPVLIEVPFTVGGVATTPTAAAWTVVPPAESGLPALEYDYPGAETSVPAVGTLRLTVPAAALSVAGTWGWEVVTTGAAAAGAQGSFYRRARPGGVG